MATRPVPQDHKKKAAAETAATPYTFTGVDGKEYALPTSSQLTAGVVRKTRHLEEMDQAFTILEAMLEPESLEALDALPVDLFNAVLMGWQAHIGATPGKSLSSST